MLVRKGALEMLDTVIIIIIIFLKFALQTKRNQKLHLHKITENAFPQSSGLE